MAKPVAKYADPIVLADLAAGIEAGGTIADACKYAGIGERTWSRWKQRGEVERLRIAEAEAHDTPVEINPVEAPFVAFVDRMDQAAASAKLGALRSVRKAIDGWDFEETTEVVKDIAYERDDHEIVHAVQTTTTTKRRRDFAWAAAMTWLERRYPSEFARLVRNEVTGAEGAPLIGTAAELQAQIDEQLDQLAEKRRQHEKAQARAANGET
jgi:hypothetical protein